MAEKVIATAFIDVKRWNTCSLWGRRGLDVAATS